MKKVLVQADNLDEFICREEATLYVDASMILTPGAKDELLKRGVAVVRTSCASSAPHAALSGEKNIEGLLLGVATIIRQECGITDPERLKAASLQAVQTIRDNL